MLLVFPPKALLLFAPVPSLEIPVAQNTTHYNLLRGFFFLREYFSLLGGAKALEWKLGGTESCSCSNENENSSQETLGARGAATLSASRRIEFLNCNGKQRLCRTTISTGKSVGSRFG